MLQKYRIIFNFNYRIGHKKEIKAKDHFARKYFLDY